MFRFMWGHRGANRVLRGGSWNNNNTDRFRCDYRNRNNPHNRNNNRGFRLSLPYASLLRYSIFTDVEGGIREPDIPAHSRTAERANTKKRRLFW